MKDKKRERGRPKIDPILKNRRRDISLRNDLADKAVLIGGGNLSKGIRMCIDIASKLMGLIKMPPMDRE